MSVFGTPSEVLPSRRVVINMAVDEGRLNELLGKFVTDVGGELPRDQRGDR
jgi:hypothetical protein